MRVFQIYYKPEQITQLEPEFIPYFNVTCTPYFESKVIEQLVLNNEHLGSKYFGVVAYKLREKLGYMKENWKNNKNIANTSIQEFSVKQFQDELYKHKPDVMSFQRHSPHDTVLVANGFHPKFRVMWEYIMKEIGFPWSPTIIQDVFYCNYFVAKTEIYELFVKEMLSPMMALMENMSELWENSRYPQALPEHLHSSFGINHYPYHSFICERAFSWYAHLHKLQCKHY